MADSKNSRTLPLSPYQKQWFDNAARESVSPLVAPSDILSIAAEFLAARTGEWNRLEVRRDGGTPTPVRTLWKKWRSVREQRLLASKLSSSLYSRILGETCYPPSIKMKLAGDHRQITVSSFRGLKRLRGRIRDADLAAALSELRRRKSTWDEAARRLGYVEAEIEERDLVEHEAMLARTLWRRRPVSLMEVAGKLHCLLSTQDLGDRIDGEPWLQLRILLDDLVHLGYLMEARP